MPYSVEDPSMRGWISTDGRLGTMACSSCGMLLGSVISATMKRAIWARVEMVFVMFSTGRFLKVEHDGRVVALAKLLPDSVQSGLTLGRKTTKDKHHLGR